MLTILKDFADDTQRVRRTRIANVTNVLRRHDWGHRWEEIFAACDLPIPEGIVQRKRQLEAHADGLSQ